METQLGGQKGWPWAVVTWSTKSPLDSPTWNCWWLHQEQTHWGWERPGTQERMQGSYCRGAEQMVSKFQEASLKKKGEERTQAQEKCLLFSLFFFLATPFSMWDFNSPAAAAAAKSLQSCPTLCDPIDGSPRGSPVSGILQARTLEWVAISFSNAWKWKVKVKSLSRVRLPATPWTTAHHAPPSMGFSRQECWSRVPLPSP